MVNEYEWDAWRSDPLTKKCLDVIEARMESRYGEAVEYDAKKAYGLLFADPARQAQYATLQGKLSAVNDIREALGLELSDIIETEDDITED